MSQVVIDDDDSGLTYNGSWFRDEGSFSTLGSSGAPLFNTLHGTNSTGGLSYRFVGTMVQVYTTLQFSDPNGLSIQCFVDGEIISVKKPTSPQNNIQLCAQSQLSDGPHVFTLTANVTNQETFWFDYLSYIPSSSMSLNQSTLYIDSKNSQVQLGFGTGWSSSDPGYQTAQTGSQFHFDFNGVSVLWYGFFNPKMTWDTSLNTATYSIDGDTSIPFDTLVNAPSITTKPPDATQNQLLFQTADLPAGDHKLEVIYQGSSATTPLTFQFMIIQRPVSSGAAAAGVSSTTPLLMSETISPTSTAQILASSVPAPRSHKSNNGGTISGSIIGVLGFIALAVKLFLYFRRRRRDSHREKDLDFRWQLSNQPSSIPYVHARGASNPVNQLPPIVQIDTLHSVLHGIPSSPDLSTSRGIRHRPSVLTVVNTSAPTHSFVSSGPSTPPSPGKGYISANRARSIRLQDSGIRLDSNYQNTNAVEVLPPVYTVG